MIDTPKSQQLTLFDNPELYFDEHIRHAEVDGVMYWSVLDVFANYGTQKNPTQTWNTVQSMLTEQGYRSSIQIIELQFPGRGQRKTPVANLEGFMRIAQVTKFKHWEHLREMMALAGAECIRNMAQHKRDTQLGRLDRAGLSDHPETKRLQVRNQGIEVLTSLKKTIAIVCDNPHWGAIANAEYQDLFGETAQTLRELLDADNVRDGLQTPQLSALMFAESSLQVILDNQHTMSNDDIRQAINAVFVPIGQSLREICEYAGVHPITNQALLEAQS